MPAATGIARHFAPQEHARGAPCCPAPVRRKVASGTQMVDHCRRAGNIAPPPGDREMPAPPFLATWEEEIRRTPLSRFSELSHRRSGHATFATARTEIAQPGKSGSLHTAPSHGGVAVHNRDTRPTGFRFFRDDPRVGRHREAKNSPHPSGLRFEPLTGSGSDRWLRGQNLTELPHAVDALWVSAMPLTTDRRNAAQARGALQGFKASHPRDVWHRDFRANRSLSRPRRHRWNFWRKTKRHPLSVLQIFVPMKVPRYFQWVTLGEGNPKRGENMIAQGNTLGNIQ